MNPELPPAINTPEPALVSTQLSMPSPLPFLSPEEGHSFPDSRSAGFRFASEPEPASAPEASYSPIEVIQLRNSLRESFAFMQDIQRKWGPDRILSHCSHTSEVGMLLILARCPVEVVVAGFLHDVFEGYIKGEVADRRTHVQSVFGSEVYRLIDAVTEPPKSSAPGNWRTRKAAVLDSLAQGDEKVAMICCAIKTSTLSEGNEFIVRGGKITDWSAGSAEENLELYAKYEAEFDRKGVPQCLLDQYRMELNHLRFLLGPSQAD
jgi:hypothetical protein